MQHYNEAKKLSDKIFFYHRHKRAPLFYNHQEELQADNDWAASYFCANVLYKTSQQVFHCITPESLALLKETFRAETGYDVDLEKSFSKGWLRIVFGIVAVPKQFSPQQEMLKN